jgi:DNA-binding transcriptional ArsR family regulator
VLREAGLVVAERNGQEIRYELDTTVFQDVIQQLIELSTPALTKARRGLRSPLGIRRR